MKKNNVLIISLLTLSILLLLFPLACKKTEGAAGKETITITDGMNREVAVPKDIRHVICSGPGCLRYLTYLGAQDMIVAVDDIETRRSRFDARPYALANPQFKDYPIFGEFRGHDNPELIINLEPLPDVIFKTYGSMGHDPVELQQKTGIPVVVLNYGDMANYKKDMYYSLRTMGKITEKEKRAEEIITFFEKVICDLDKRTKSAPGKKKTCYVGGIAYKGPHGFQSTEPLYPPFIFTHSNNVAHDPAKSPKELKHADVAKEKIVEWDPEVIFVDLATIQSDPKASAIYELANDPAYRNLSAVEKGELYGVLPYNWYTQNFGSILANAYYVGTVLYPKQFGDISPKAKADEIYTFLVGKPVFKKMNESFEGLAYTKLKF